MNEFDREVENDKLGDQLMVVWKGKEKDIKLQEDVTGKSSEDRPYYFGTEVDDQDEEEEDLELSSLSSADE